MSETKGEAVKHFMEQLGINTYSLLASTPGEGEGGFHITVGDSEMLTTLLVMYFREYPELLMASLSTIIAISNSVTDSALRQQAADICDCEKCRKKKAKGGEDMSKFIASGKFKH